MFRQKVIKIRNLKILCAHKHSFLIPGHIYAQILLVFPDHIRCFLISCLFEDILYEISEELVKHRQYESGVEVHYIVLAKSSLQSAKTSAYSSSKTITLFYFPHSRDARSANTHKASFSSDENIGY